MIGIQILHTTCNARHSLHFELPGAVKDQIAHAEQALSGKPEWVQRDVPKVKIGNMDYAHRPVPHGRSISIGKRAGCHLMPTR